MKIGVSSYSFQQLINAGAESQLSIMKKAKEMGFDAIEFIDIDTVFIYLDVFAEEIITVVFSVYVQFDKLSSRSVGQSGA